jgi:MerR family redox-sensitive transcriptional activator SoxR
VKIGEVSKLTGVPASAIRYYESAGILRYADRNSGKRSFDRNLLKQIEVVKRARSLGFSIRETKNLIHQLDSPTSKHSWRHLAEQKLLELEVVIKNARQMKKTIYAILNCKCRDSHECRVTT